MREHHIGPVARDLVVERDRPPLIGPRRMLEPDRRPRPAARQRRHHVGARLGAGLQATAGERARARSLTTRSTRSGCRCSVVRLSASSSRSAASRSRIRRSCSSSPPRSSQAGEAGVVERRAAAEHRLLDLRGDHRTGAPEVLADLLDLRHHAREEIEIALERPALRGLPPGADAVVHEHLGGRLAVAVDPAVALLQAIRVPRDLGMREQMTLALQRDPLRRRVGRQQHADRVVGRRLLPLALDPLALLRARRAVEQLDPVAGDPPRRSAAPGGSAASPGTPRTRSLAGR